MEDPISLNIASGFLGNSGEYAAPKSSNTVSAPQIISRGRSNVVRTVRQNVHRGRAVTSRSPSPAPPARSTSPVSYSPMTLQSLSVPTSSVATPVKIGAPNSRITRVQAMQGTRYLPVPRANLTRSSGAKATHFSSQKHTAQQTRNA